MIQKARSLKSMPERGDVFSVSLGTWGFTACRVVAVKARPVSVLVVGSEYLDAKPASMDAPDVYRIPILTHHAFDSEPLAFWTPMVITPEFEKLGSAEPAEGEDQLAKGKMANWDYIIVHRILQAQWNNIPRPAAASSVDSLHELQKTTSRPKLLTPTEIIQRFRSLDRPGAKAVADVLQSLRQAMAGADGAANTRTQLVAKCIESLNRVEQDTECIDTVERDWLMAFFLETAKTNEITDIHGLIDSLRDW